MRPALLVASMAGVALILLGTVWLGRRVESEGPGAVQPEPTAPALEAVEDALAPAELPAPVESQAEQGWSGGARKATPEPNPTALGSLRLRAQDALTGKPVKRFWIKRSGTLDMASPPRPVLSDPSSGEALLPGSLWGAGAAHKPEAFLVSSPLYAPLNVAIRAPGSTSAVETVKLQRSAGIVGVVRDGSSSPLGKAKVRLEFMAPMGEGDGASPGTEIYGGPTLRLTDEQGTYAFGQLLPGRYRTRVERDGIEHVSDPVDVRPGRWSLGDHWLDEHVRLAVSVLLPTGEPAAGTRILLVGLDADAELIPPGPGHGLPDHYEIAASRYTDTEGRATLGPLKEGTYGVYLQSDDGAAAPRSLRVQGQSRSLLEEEFQLTSMGPSSADR